MILLMSLLFMPQAFAANNFDVAKASIKYVQPDLKDQEASVITSALLKHSSYYKLDWRIMAAIVAQESSFRKDPQDCLHIKTKCADLGIAQINFFTWGKELKLDRKKLLTDVSYNIETMAKILSRLKETYGKEPKWHTRYHSFTNSHRKTYADFIYHKYLKISSYAKGYADSQIRYDEGVISVSKRRKI